MISPGSIPIASSLWDNPQLVGMIAASAVALLIATVWLIRRRSRDGRGAAAICLTVSVLLHALLIYFLPALQSRGGGQSASADSNDEPASAEFTIASFEPSAEVNDLASPDPAPELRPSLIVPLPLPDPAIDTIATNEIKTDKPAVEPEIDTEPASMRDATSVPNTLAMASTSTTAATSADSLMDDLLSKWLSDDAARGVNEQGPDAIPAAKPIVAIPVSRSTMPQARVPGVEDNDFGKRAGDAKRAALLATGGDESTEAAVAAALRFLAADQRIDGAWDPATSGAGRETRTLGTDRGGAGKNATNGITGLALLSMLGAGNTHLDGPYADNVRRGLSYLIRSQHPDGSLAGPATAAEANYCHGMAALVMCEAAAMTGDESALRSAAAAIRYTSTAQHPTTGGWRYVRGDPGDLSQLGWQAMVLDGGRRASIPVSPQSLAGTTRFLRSVRMGDHGGLASYRPGEAPSRTMTAEALATRLLLGEKIPPAEIAEAEAYLMRQPPGVGRDNYYGWYYTSLALHQLQDDAWVQWNEAMKRHLLSRQLATGSWPNDDEWGGYGGRIYSTAVATLCLEVYYRHELRTP